MAKRFNLSDYITQAEDKLDQGRKVLEYVPLNQVAPDPRNFYSTDGIEELAASIQTVGQIDPFWLRQTEDGRYHVISGHRRRLAYQVLVIRGDFPSDGAVPAFIERGEPSMPGVAADKRTEAKPLLEKLKLLLANSDTREKTAADKAQEIRELTETFTALKGLGFDFPGSMRTHIAAAAHVSESRVARLSVIERGLTSPNLRNAFQDGRLGESAAYEIARRDPDVVARCEETAAFCSRLTLDELKTYLDKIEKDLAEEKAEVKAVEDGIKAMAVEVSDKSDKALDDYLEKRAEEDDEYFEMLTEFVGRGYLLGALETVNSRREGIEALKDRYGSAYVTTSGGGLYSRSDPKGLGLNHLIGPHNKFGQIKRTWTEVYDLLAAMALNRWALGKGGGEQRAAEASAPTGGDVVSPRFFTGDPPRDGRYLCFVKGVKSSLFTNEYIMDYKDGVFLFYGEPLPEDCGELKGWWPLPAKEG